MVWAALITALGALAVAAVGFFQSRASAKASPYDSLAGRIVTLEGAYDEERRKRGKLERDVEDLDHDLNLVVDAMHEQITWQDAGADPPPRAIKAHVRELVARRREARA